MVSLLLVFNCVLMFQIVQLAIQGMMSFSTVFLSHSLGLLRGPVYRSQTSPVKSLYASWVIFSLWIPLMTIPGKSALGIFGNTCLVFASNS